jgi:hypothetical protein
LTRAAGVCGVTCIAKVPTPGRERNLYRCNGGPTTSHPEGECPNTVVVYAGDIERRGQITASPIRIRFKKKALMGPGYPKKKDMAPYVQVCGCGVKGMMDGPPCNGIKCQPHRDLILERQDT